MPPTRALVGGVPPPPAKRLRYEPEATTNRTPSEALLNAGPSVTQARQAGRGLHNISNVLGQGIWPSVNASRSSGSVVRTNAVVSLAVVSAKRIDNQTAQDVNRDAAAGVFTFRPTAKEFKPELKQIFPFVSGSPNNTLLPPQIAPAQAALEPTGSVGSERLRLTGITHTPKSMPAPKFEEIQDYINEKFQKLSINHAPEPAPDTKVEESYSDIIQKLHKLSINHASGDECSCILCRCIFFAKPGNLERCGVAEGTDCPLCRNINKLLDTLMADYSRICDTEKDALKQEHEATISELKLEMESSFVDTKGCKFFASGGDAMCTDTEDDTGCATCKLVKSKLDERDLDFEVEIKTKYLAELNKQIQRFRQKKEEMRSAQKEEIAKVSQAHLQERNDLESRYKRELARSNAKIAKLKDEKEKEAEREREEFDAQIQEIYDATDKVKAEEKQLKEDLEQHKQLLAVLQESVAKEVRERGVEYTMLVKQPKKKGKK